jgi:glucose 1-dehydrogenase
VHVRGALLCAHEVIKHALDDSKTGAIVNVSSVQQIIAKRRVFPYAVSKSGMQNLTRTLARAYAGRGIRVNGSGPGPTITPINHSPWR